MSLDFIDVCVLSVGGGPHQAMSPDAPRASCSVGKSQRSFVVAALTGFSDSKWLSRLGIKMYGFSPLQVPEDFPYTKLPHGHDERIPRDGYEWGVETLWQAVTRFCCA